MITVKEAREILHSQIKHFGIEPISLQESLGRVLAQNILTDRPLPPYHRVTMDGIAIKFDSYASGRREFAIENIAPAGAAQLTLVNPDSCIEVMTGAVLPIGTDTVIRYEDLDIEPEIIKLKDISISFQQNIHFKGSDRPEQEIVIKSDMAISQAEIGIAASTGYDMVDVWKLPSVAIISTGDELVDIDQTPEPYQIRKSNVHMIQASLQHLNINAERYHIDDDYNAVLAKLKELLNNYDVLILSGGVSKGKFDYLPKAFNELGVQKLFHKIKQRPGKPFWFGTLPDNCTIFALPGNPVSSFMCTINYVLPWLRSSLNNKTNEDVFAVLDTEIEFKPDLSYYPIVQTYFTSTGILKARPVNNNGSGDFASLTDGNAFLELPRGKNVYPADEPYRCLAYRFK